MGKLNELLQNLPSNLRAIVRGDYTHEQLNKVVELSHAFAITLLKKKLSSGRLNLNLVHLDIHDIAYDCIAELFRRDGEFPLIQLKSYFAGIDIEHSSPQQLADHIRRLTFSKVNQGMFRLYSEYDSSLGKILRNIKITIQSLNTFVEVDRFGETYLIPAIEREDFSLPIVDHDTFVYWLRDMLNGNERIPEVLSKLSLYIQEQHEYAKAISFIGLAISLRSLYAEELESLHQQPEPHRVQDSVITIEHTCRKVQQRMNARYVGTHKLSSSEYQAMFKAIQNNLIAVVVEKDGSDFSLYERMKQDLPELTKERYTKMHKPIIEYLFSLTKQELARTLKKEQ